MLNDCSGVYNAVAPEIITNKQFVKAYAKELGRPAIIPLPTFALNAIFGSERASIITQSQVRTVTNQFDIKSLQLFLRQLSLCELWNLDSVLNIQQ